MTLTGIAADMRSSPSVTTIRRILAVLTMLLAVVGSFVVLNLSIAWALGLALVLLGAVVAVAALQSRRAAPWQVHTA
jgi:hypothetical protein